MVDLIIPENPQPITEAWGFAYGIEDASGEVILATTVIMRAEPKSGGLKTDRVDTAEAAHLMAKSILDFAAGIDEAKRVRYMSPTEYAEWCDENCDDEDETEEDDDYGCDSED
jgi:hypothetical protein